MQKQTLTEHHGNIRNKNNTKNHCALHFSLLVPETAMPNQFHEAFSNSASFEHTIELIHLYPEGVKEEDKIRPPMI
jgi:hypothetical protein